MTCLTSFLIIDCDFPQLSGHSVPSCLVQAPMTLSGSDSPHPSIMSSRTTFFRLFHQHNPQQSPSYRTSLVLTLSSPPTSHTLLPSPRPPPPTSSFPSALCIRRGRVSCVVSRRAAAKALFSIRRGRVWCLGGRPRRVPRLIFDIKQLRSSRYSP